MYQYYNKSVTCVWLALSLWRPLSFRALGECLQVLHRLYAAVLQQLNPESSLRDNGAMSPIYLVKKGVQFGKLNRGCSSNPPVRGFHNRSNNNKVTSTIHLTDEMKSFIFDLITQWSSNCFLQCLLRKNVLRLASTLKNVILYHRHRTCERLSTWRYY